MENGRNGPGSLTYDRGEQEKQVRVSTEEKNSWIPARIGRIRDRRVGDSSSSAVLRKAPFRAKADREREILSRMQI
jgi:hypothetical protein